MLDAKTVLYRAEQYKDHVAEAEKERLLGQISARSASFAKLYRRWLAYLGTRMVEWGNRLQARYRDALTMTKTAQHAG